MAYKELPEGSLEQYETASTLRYDGTKDYGNVNAGKNLALGQDASGKAQMPGDGDQVLMQFNAMNPNGDATGYRKGRLYFLQSAADVCTVGEPIVAALKGSDKGYVKSPAKPTLDPASAGNPTDAELAAYSAAIVEYTLAASRWRVLEIVSNTVGGLVVVESV